MTRMNKIKRLLAAAVATAFTGASAIAADMDLLYKAPPPEPVFTWSSFFIGGHFGKAWGSTSWYENESSSATGGIAAPGFTDASFSESNWLGGGQIGFDYQTGWIVWGAWADASGGNISGSSGCFSEVVGTAQTCKTSISALGTATARLGIALDRALLYGLVGWAWANERHENACNTCGAGGVATLAISPEVMNGWTVGVGGEYALTRNWSAFAQYNYIDFGTWGSNFNNVPAVILPTFTENIRQSLSIFKVGINYRFGQPNAY